MLSATDDICQQLHAAATLTANVTLWLATDGNVQAHSEAMQEAIAQRKVTALPIKLPHPEIDPMWFPQWMALNTAQADDSDVLRQSVEGALAELAPQSLVRGQGRQMAGWLEIDAAPETTASALGSAMVQVRPDGKRCLLRWHDPAVLWALWPLMTQDQQAAWLGSIRRWWLLDPLGQLVSLTRPNGATAGTSAAKAFTPEQWRDIDHITALNHGLRQRLAQPLPVQPQELVRLRDQGLVALRRARALGFTDGADLACFAEHALCHSPQFDQTPKVRLALSRRGPGQPLGGVLAELTDQDWLDIQKAAPAA